MSTVLAIFRRDGEKVDPGEMDAMLNSLQNRITDGHDIYRQGCVILAHQHLWITPEEQGERQPLTTANRRYSVSFDGRLDNRQRLLERLDLIGSTMGSISDAQLVLNAYARWQEECVTELLGDFAFTVWDATERKLFIARDPLGVRQIAYYCDPFWCIVGSTVTPILSHPKVNIAINDGKVAEYIVQYESNHEESFFRDVYFCPPAHYILITENEIRKRRYWLPNLEEVARYDSLQSYAEHLRHLFVQAVQARLRFVGKPGSMLSSGMDSSSVTAVVHNALMDRDCLSDSGLSTYTFTYPGVPESDEGPSVRDFENCFRLNSTYLRVDDILIFQEIPLPFMAPDYLSYVMSGALYRPLCNKLRRDDIQLVFSGAFGDTLFVKERLWTADATRDRRLQIAKKLLTPAERRKARTMVAKQEIKRRVKSYAKSIVRRDSNKVDRNEYYTQFGICKSFAQTVDIVERTATHPLEQYYATQAHMDVAGYLHWGQVTHGSSVLLQGMHDLGIEVWDPFRDRRLVEYVLSVPAYVVGLPKPGMNKLVLREAMRGILPESTRTRPRHKGPMAWANTWFAGAEAQRLDQLLSDSLVVQQGYYEPTWIEQRLMSQRQAPKYDYELWKCVCLELWLRSYGPSSDYFTLRSTITCE